MNKINFRALVYISTLFAITCVLITSCKSDEEKIKEAEELTKTFVSNLKFKNENECYVIYPKFKGIGEYYIINNYRITSSNIKNDTITIFGKYDRVSQENKELMFVIAQNNNHKYEIIASKGISAYWDSNLYKYLKGSGCFTFFELFSIDEYDKDIAETCNSYKDCWNKIVDFHTAIVETVVTMSDHNVSKSYGSISGNITVKNPSDIAIPAYTYDLYIELMDNNGNVIHREKSNYTNGFKPKSQTSINIFTDDNRLYKKIGTRLKITDRSIIENFLAKHPEDNISDLQNLCDTLSALYHKLNNQY